MNKSFLTIEHHVDFCVVGGGLAGMCAAISAARHGLKVAIMQDRPLFGGNASSEIRMWVSGAHGQNNRETGILEEIALENLYRNPYRTWPIWDTILFEKVKEEKNITVILNCSCNNIEMANTKILSVLGWQTTTQKWHKVHATFFADCSGDSVLAPLTGAEYRMGREGREEFQENIAPVCADQKTMGMSCLIQARQTNHKCSFIPPTWANKYTKEDLPYRIPNIEDPRENFWYMELGGENDSIGDTEEIRDELLKVALGIWDYIKNVSDTPADNWELDFLGFLPGKRESRRYVGDYIMTQTDVENSGKFDDIVAYGGWTMDDHNPGGINTREKPNIFHPAPSPFGIPYRCLYSKNIENLFFAGRNISVTHSAMSASRVMATCAVLGQAVGTAAAVAKRCNTTPRGVYTNFIRTLQDDLMFDDCYLPFIERTPSPIMKEAILQTKYANLTNGSERGFEENGTEIDCKESIVMDFKSPQNVHLVRMILDSDLERQTTGGQNWMPKKTTIANVALDMEPVQLPVYLARDIVVEYLDDTGKWHILCEIFENRKRLLVVDVNKTIHALRITFPQAWGGDKVRLFSLTAY